MAPEATPERRSRRGYSWAPFAPGHGERHGAYSPRAWRPVADRLAAEVVDVAPWAARPTFAGTVAAWSRVEAQLHLVAAWLDEHGPLDDEGAPRPATTLQARLDAQAANLRAELGLSPLALAKLLGAFAAAVQGGQDDGGALDALKAEGRRVLEARAASETAGALGVPGPDEAA